VQAGEQLAEDRRVEVAGPLITFTFKYQVRSGAVDE
jgi:hypothetical protein